MIHLDDNYNDKSVNYSNFAFQLTSKTYFPLRRKSMYVCHVIKFY